MATTTFHRKGLSALSAYSQGCRCSDCRAAKIKYEKMKRAKEHTLTLDDAWLVVNRENRDNKIAKAQSAEMRKQMKNVNAVPNSVSTQNNQGQSQNPADSVFDALLGDGNVDNLFGNN